MIDDNATILLGQGIFLMNASWSQGVMRPTTMAAHGSET